MISSLSIIILCITIIICILLPYIFSMHNGTPRLRRRESGSRTRQIPEQTPQPLTVTPIVLTDPEPGFIFPGQNDNDKTCLGWILENDLTGDYRQDLTVSINRSMRYYTGYPFFVSGYVYGLFQNPWSQIVPYAPNIFCNRLVADTAYYRHITMKDARFTCQGWIHFYGINQVIDTFDITRMQARNEELDDHISIWASTYMKYVLESQRWISAAEFCAGVGQVIINPPQLYPFMTVDSSFMSCSNPDDFNGIDDPENFAASIARDTFTALGGVTPECRETRQQKLQFITKATPMSCESWLHAYGFTTNGQTNYVKINNLYNRVGMLFDAALPFWVREYVIALRRGRGEDLRSPWRFCRNSHRPSIIALSFYGRYISFTPTAPL